MEKVTLHMTGEVVEVPETEALDLIRLGIATKASTPKKKSTPKAEKATGDEDTNE